MRSALILMFASYSFAPPLPFMFASFENTIIRLDKTIQLAI
jgi:hypothetical protein